MGIYRNEALDIIARNIISGYDPRLLLEPALIPIETIMERIYGLTVDFRHICKERDGRVLGETVFEDTVLPIYDSRHGCYKLMPVKAGTVLIDISLSGCKNGGRLRYTYAHELAHWVIDSCYFVPHRETASTAGKPAGNTRTDAAAIERQADRLACRLLMPIDTVKKAFYRAYGTYGKADNTISALSRLYGVSRQAMQIRLSELRLLPWQ